MTRGASARRSLVGAALPLFGCTPTAYTYFYVHRPRKRGKFVRGVRIIPVLALLFGFLGAGAAGASSLAESSPGWSPPVSGVSAWTKVSCASPSFCAAAYTNDSNNDQVGLSTFNGRTWSTVTLDGFNAVPYGNISCPSNSFCAGEASDSNQNSLVFTYNSATNRWTSQSIMLNSYTVDVAGVSCTSATFCVATGSVLAATAVGDNWTGVSIYNGTQWSPPKTLNIGVQTMQFVSCPSPSFCLTVDGHGAGYIFNGTSWSAAPSANDSANLTSLSCLSSSFCVASDDAGNVLTYNGTLWSIVAVAKPAGDELYDVSCASMSFCVAVGEVAQASVYNGSSWTWQQPINPNNGGPQYTNLVAVSCPTTSFCAVLDDQGDALTYSSGTGASSTKSSLPHSPSGPVRAIRITTTSITLSWGAPRNGPQPTSYDIMRRLPGGSYTLIGSTRARTRQFTVRRLRPHTRYRFLVYAADAAGSSANGPVGSFLTAG